MTTFWANNPTILLNKNYITQVWPTQSMTFEEKLNAISRAVLLLTVLGFFVTRNTNIIIIGVLTLGIVFTMYKFRKNKITKEGFRDNSSKSDKQDSVETLQQILKSDFYPTNKKNPMGNVLLTEINDTPNRPSAAPSFNPDVYDEINSAVKKQTQMLNPDIKSTNKQLYGDLYDNWNLDQSMRRFYSTANTRVENDQGAFSQWLYGDLISSKESNIGGEIARVKDSYRYILI
jgi:hypothetical protein